MKCYCEEKKDEFIFYVENAPEKYHKNIMDAWYEKSGNKFLKKYSNTVDDKELIKENFSKLGESMFRGNGDWKNALYLFLKKCEEHNIEWYITGSISEAAMGVKIQPHDIDIVTHVKDFYKVKEVFKEYVIEPFVDNEGSWVVRYFGRLCIEGVMLDIVADESRNKERYTYQTLDWKGYKINVEPLEHRYNVELERERKERIKAIEEYISNNTN